MTQKTSARDRAFSPTVVRPAKESVQRPLFELIRQSVSFSQGLLFSMLPRGSLYLVQPGRISESLLQGYNEHLHCDDFPSWQAILRGQTVRVADCWSPAELESSDYFRKLLKPSGLHYGVIAALSMPIFNGYPGAVALFRDQEEGDFSDAEFGKLKTLGRDVDELINKSRQARNTELAVQTDPWTHAAPNRIFIFNREGKSFFPKKSFGLDPKLEEQLKEQAPAVIDASKRSDVFSTRLSLPDSRGDLWVFNAVVHREYPAIGQGPFIFFMLQPESFEWTTVRPGDVAADPELVKMLPTLKFMQQEFNGNPTLEEIAKKAHLSPFHFHRRFVDLIGQTPKHFMLGCQLHEAQRLLASRRRELAQIASDCGFAHQSHFTSRFKQATGLTPTRWRRMAADIVRNGGRK